MKLMSKRFRVFLTFDVFFVGDVFDEGNWVNEDGFSNYMKRFNSLFSVKENGKTRSFVVTGNHDMGFHYE